MKDPQKISEHVARQLKPELFRAPEQYICHIALVAFPHVSRTLCGKRLTDLEHVRKEALVNFSLLCDDCVHRLGELAARLIK